MKNNNIVIGILILIVIILGLVVFKKPVTAPDSTDDTISEAEDGMSLYKGKGFSFRYDQLAKVSVEGSGASALYTVSKEGDGGAADYFSFFPEGMPNPSEYNPCGEMPVKSMTIGNKLFSYCDSKAEPVRTYIYKDGDKAATISVNMVNGKSDTGYIDLTSIDLK